MSGRPVVGVITFPGSNGDYDALHAMREDVGVEARFVDYRETSLSGIDAVVLPGGFSYGDHLRCGAIARFAPVMAPLAEFAGAGGPVLGICNGFQVLTEAHLLPGALLRNGTMRFHCHWSHIRIESDRTAWTGGIAEATVLRLPVAHGEGSYFADPETIAMLEAQGQIVARYCTPDGTVDESSNRNGSVGSIAAVSNAAGNVVGIMPHPERAANELVGGADGLRLLRAVLGGAVAAPA
ncbi:MAG TPA: phosphoribosylformylglycinamidine synthase subunit PurQ [Thermomicrobiales bacterium]|jgi:phosphoribosylformylglycinamidine synthase|nr:phosphoribosylformylglycinamidine synthase subunit PurQ [Thermomicrobiales bacterium]